MALAVQPYPRVADQDDKEFGLLDTKSLKSLPNKIDLTKMPDLILKAIEYSDKKTRQEVVEISKEMSPQDIQKSYNSAGKKLFKYFKRPDPAFMIKHLIGKSYTEIAQEFFDKRKTHLISMNAGWRYQYLLVGCAQASKRFESVSDLSTGNSDVNITIKDNKNKLVSIYISLKNRKDTISGGSGAAVLNKLEITARTDKNKTGAYCCVVALGMQTQQHRGKTKHSPNVEIWPSNFLWPFVSGYTYSEIVKLTSNTIKGASFLPALPIEVIEAFKAQCEKHQLLDKQGIFNDEDAIIDLLCKV